METVAEKIATLGDTVKKKFKVVLNHHWVMVLGCLIPIVALFILPAIGVDLGGLQVFLIVLCPLSHLFMMRSMYDHHSKKVDRDRTAREKVPH
jgi:hypothetical protein